MSLLVTHWDATALGSFRPKDLEGARRVFNCLLVSSLVGSLLDDVFLDVTTRSLEAMDGLDDTGSFDDVVNLDEGSFNLK